MSDGVDHINVYSKGKTPLGVYLSNFTEFKFDIPELGDAEFSSVEALWYYLGFEDFWGQPEVEALRPLSGFQAKKYGQALRLKWGYRQDNKEFFQNCILEATAAKIIFNPRMKKLYMDNNLPFVHYYVVRGAIVTSTSNKFQMDYINVTLRKYLGLEPLE